MRFNSDLYRLTTGRQFAQPALVIDLLDQDQISEAITHRLLLDGLKPVQVPALPSASAVLRHVHPLGPVQCLQLSKAIGAHKLAREFTQQLRAVIQQHWEELDRLEGPLAEAKERVTPKTLTDDEWDEYTKLCKHHGFSPSQTKYPTNQNIERDAEIGVYKGIIENLTEVCNFYNKMKLELTAYQERAKVQGAPEAAQLTDQGILDDGADHLDDGADPSGSMRSFMLNEATDITRRVDKFLSDTGKTNLTDLSPEEWATALEAEANTSTKQWALSLAHLIYYDDACAPKPLTGGGMAFKRYLFLTDAQRNLAQTQKIQKQNLTPAQASIVTRVAALNTDPLKRWEEFKTLGETQHLAQCAAVRDYLDTTTIGTEVGERFREQLMDFMAKQLSQQSPSIS